MPRLDQAAALYVGATAVNRAYLGAVEVYTSGPRPHYVEWVQNNGVFENRNNLIGNTPDTYATTLKSDDCDIRFGRLAQELGLPNGSTLTGVRFDIKLRGYASVRAAVNTLEAPSKAIDTQQTPTVTTLEWTGLSVVVDDSTDQWLYCRKNYGFAQNEWYMITAYLTHSP